MLTRADRQASGIPHVHVVAAQLLCDGAAGPRQFHDDVLRPQRRHQVRQVRPQVSMRAQRRGVAVTARQVGIQELLDEGFVDVLG